MRGLDMQQVGGAQRLSDWLDAQNPNYGRPNWQRWRALVDSMGQEYAQDFFVYTIDLGALNAAATSINQIQIERNSAFEAIELTGGAGAAGGVLSQAHGVTLMISDSASSRQLMNQAVPMVNMIGSGDFPFTLPLNRRFMPMTQVGVFANNYETNNLADVQLALIGRKIWLDAQHGGSTLPLQRFNTFTGADGCVYSEDLFYYDFSLAALTNGTTTPVTVITEAESDFEWIMSTASSLTGNGTPIDATQTAVNVNVKDTGSGRYLFSNPTPMGLIAGSGLQPFILPQTRIFEAKVPITIEFQNKSGAEIDNIHFTMIGRKIFEQD